MNKKEMKRKKKKKEKKHGYRTSNVNLEGKVIPAPINRINHPNLSDSLPNADPVHLSLIAAGPSAGLRLTVKGQIGTLPSCTTL